MKVDEYRTNRSIENIKSNGELLRLLGSSKTKPKYKKAIINAADRKLIEAICDSTYNVLNGNVSIDNNQRQQLYKYRTLLRKLIQKSSIANKRKILLKSSQNQEGGFLPALLAAVAGPLLGGISSWVVDKVFNKDQSE